MSGQHPSFNSGGGRNPSSLSFKQTWCVVFFCVCLFVFLYLAGGGGEVGEVTWEGGGVLGVAPTPRWRKLGHEDAAAGRLGLIVKRKRQRTPPPMIAYGGPPSSPHPDPSHLPPEPAAEVLGQKQSLVPDRFPEASGWLRSAGRLTLTREAGWKTINTSARALVSIWRGGEAAAHHTLLTGPK